MTHNFCLSLIIDCNQLFILFKISKFSKITQSLSLNTFHYLSFSLPINLTSFIPLSLSLSISLARSPNPSVYYFSFLSIRLHSVAYRFLIWLRFSSYQECYLKQKELARRRCPHQGRLQKKKKLKKQLKCRFYFISDERILFSRRKLIFYDRYMGSRSFNGQLHHFLLRAQCRMLMVKLAVSLQETCVILCKAVSVILNWNL